MAENTRKLVAELSKKLHQNSWALIPGTGVAIKEGSKVFIPPGEVHLDRLQSEDIFTFNCEFDKAGNPELDNDATNPALNISAYTNLFLKVFQEFDCGCIIYAQPRSAVVVAELNKKFFKIKNNQMISQISNGETKEQYPWTHELSVPIVANPDDQTKLFGRLEKAFEESPETNAVIIKGNGLFVCGDTWTETMTMFESLLYLFNTSLELGRAKQGVDQVDVVAASKKVVEAEVQKAVKTIRASSVSNGKPSSRPVEKPSFSKPVKTFVATKPAKMSSFREEKERSYVSNYNELAMRRKKLALARLRMGQRGGSVAGRRSAASFMIGGQQEDDMGQQQAYSNQQAMMNQQMMNQQMMNQQMMNQQMMANQQRMQNENMMNMENNFMQGGHQMGGGSPVKRSSNSLFRSLSRRGGPVISSRGSRGARRGGSVKERLGFKSNISVDPVALKKGLQGVSAEDY